MPSKWPGTHAALIPIVFLVGLILLRLDVLLLQQGRLADAHGAAQTDASRHEKQAHGDKVGYDIANPNGYTKTILGCEGLGLSDRKEVSDDEVADRPYP